MDYSVSEEALSEKYSKWKDAMILQLNHSLNTSLNVDFPQHYTIDSVLKFNILVSGISGLLHARFRGEARYHSNPCLPIIARGSDESKDSNYEIGEINRFRNTPTAEKYKTRLPESDITWWMLTQHYSGFDTRLLDITRNALVALYFACHKHLDKNGYVYIFHSMDKTAVPLNNDYGSYTDHIQDFSDYYGKDHYIHMRPTVSLDRINRQEGEFLWIKNYMDLKTNGLFESNQIIPIIIKKEFKKRIINELNDPQGINPEYLQIESDI